VVAAFNRSDNGIEHPSKSDTLMGAQFQTRLKARRRPGGQDTAESARVPGVRFLAPILGLVIVALVCGVLVIQGLVSPPEAVTTASAGSMGSADGLWFTVQSAVWVSQDRNKEQNIPQSAGSNPVTKPHGLQVELKVQNRGDEIRILEPQDFRLQSQNGTTWFPREHTFPLTALGPRQYLHSVLAFDAPESAAGLRLVWSRSGHEVRLLIGAAALARGGAEPKADDVSSCLPTMEVKCAGGLRPSSIRTEGKE
jgi:hypothetical protein